MNIENLIKIKLPQHENFGRKVIQLCDWFDLNLLGSIFKKDTSVENKLNLKDLQKNFSF